MQKTFVLSLLAALGSTQTTYPFDYVKNCDCRAFPKRSQGESVCYQHCCKDLYVGDPAECVYGGWIK